MPGSALVGADIQGEFHNMGRTLFRDGGDQDSVPRLDARLIEADLFADDGPSAKHWEALRGKFDVLQVSAFLHMFLWEKQRDAGIRIVRLLKAEPGALVVGTQVGSAKPGVYEQGRMYLHDVESFKKLWEEIGQATGSRWKVAAELTAHADEKNPWNSTDVRKINFEVTRLE